MKTDILGTQNKMGKSHFSFDEETQTKQHTFEHLAET